MKVTHLLQYIGIFVTAVGFFHEISVRISSLLTSVRIFTFLQVSESQVFWQMSGPLFSEDECLNLLSSDKCQDLHFLKMSVRILCLLTSVWTFIFWRRVSDLLSSDKCLDLYLLKMTLRISSLLTCGRIFTLLQVPESLVF